MPSSKSLKNYSKTSRTPRRPFEKERLDAELRIVGKYGLKNKREVWRTGKGLSQMRATARELLKLDAKDPKRIFEGEALMRRLHRLGVLPEDQNQLDYVLSLTLNHFFDRRLQTQVWTANLAKSIHHARVLIRQRHIRVGRQIVNVPSFMVRVESAPHIDFALTSAFGGGRAGRIKRKKEKSKDKPAQEDEE